MTPQKLEELIIRSLDVPMTGQEQFELNRALESDSLIAQEFAQHNAIRDMLKRKHPATFGPYFVSKLINKIQNSGVVIDHQLFLFFKKFQLAAIGIVVALVVANIILSEENTIPSFLGIEQSTQANEEIVSFDYSQSLIK